MTKIYILNGPPSSGKDSLADYMVSKNSVFKKEKFANPLKLANQALFSMTNEEMSNYDTDAVLKNTKSDRFGGKSWRDVNKDLSELYVKPHFDKSFFGRSLMNRIKNSNSEYFIISDGGFVEEVSPLVEAFGKDSVILIKLYREGFDFSGDSRNYIPSEELGIKEYKLINDKLEPYLYSGERLLYSLTYG